MAKKPKMSDKLKEGVSVQEIEDFARKYMSEVFVVLAIIIASISSTFDFFTGPGWSICLAGLGSVVAIIFPRQIKEFVTKVHNFMNKQQKSTQIIIGVVRLIVALFIPLLLFAVIGLHAGLAIHDFEKKSQM